MKADTKFTTAIHLCLYLHYRGEKVLTSREMAESVATNAVVIRRLATELRKAGIIESTAGKLGGFYLKKNIRQITLWDIYKAVNDRDFFHKPKVNAECPVSSNLAELITRPFLDAELAMRPSLEKINIAELYHQLISLLEQQKISNLKIQKVE